MSRRCNRNCVVGGGGTNDQPPLICARCTHVRLPLAFLCMHPMMHPAPFSHCADVVTGVAHESPMHGGVTSVRDKAWRGAWGLPRAPRTPHTDTASDHLCAALNLAAPA